MNDAAGQIGADFYAHHMKMIINTLLYYNIIPIVVELPEIGIIEYTNCTNIFYKIRYKLSAKFNNNGEIDNIKTYRKRLNDHLVENKLSDKIIFIDFDEICPDFDNCRTLYREDGLHLNLEGNKALSKNIVYTLLKKIKHGKNFLNLSTNN